MTPKKKKTEKSAVALRYQAAKFQAPKVTAKGRGLLADKIIAMAQDHGIPVKEDADLVQVLSQVDIGQEVPPSVYRVVAELLAFVYQMNQEFKNETLKTEAGL
ncbi:MAG: EscU/YscU/HrcU family type III secretion system export apparatus switch protein [Nitrospinales bacterium]